jgi:hypothetical protein
MNANAFDMNSAVLAAGRVDGERIVPHHDSPNALKQQPRPLR